MARLKILSVASEVYPLVKTGGLADVAGALPEALKNQQIDVRTLMPGYPAVMAALEKPRRAFQFDDLHGGPATLWRAAAQGLDLLVLDAPHLYDKPGNPYLGPDGRDWPDNAERFAALSRVAAAIGQGLLANYAPALIHVHDWQAALVPAYLHYGGGGPPVVLTIHNLAYQGVFPPSVLPRIGLPKSAYDVEGLEYYGDISFLKAGLMFADRITTVSPSYAAEIMTSEGGMGMDGLLQRRAGDLSGLLNGIDDKAWNPATDPLIAHRFSRDDIKPRAINKAVLQRHFELDGNADTPLFAVVSRLTEQKGLDLLLDALPVLIGEGAQLAVLGSGDADLEAGFRAAALEHAGRIGCIIGYDEALAHGLQAGADAVLVPSRFEPCGLTQLCAQRYGAVPVVARVGGLADTVIDANPAALAAGVATGIQFQPPSQAMLENAIRRTVALYRDKAQWRRIQYNGLAADVSWRGAAPGYARLFRSLCRDGRPTAQ